MSKTLAQILKDNKGLLKPKEYAQKFTGERFLGLFRPGVYIMLKGEQFLYVGKCKRQLIKRVVVSNEKALDNATALQLIPCKTFEMAGRLEKILIQELKPKYNTRLKRLNR